MTFATCTFVWIPISMFWVLWYGGYLSSALLLWKILPRYVMGNDLIDKIYL